VQLLFSQVGCHHALESWDDMKKRETAQRFATATQALSWLSMKRTGFYRQPSHTKVTPGCQGDRLFEENLFLFFLSSQERRMSSLNSRMANKVKFVCH
jgi:hypothetical protein